MPSRPRLSARRGSTTAPDPFGVHADVNLNPNRSSSSVLTIVRVPSNAVTTPPVALDQPPSSPVLSQRRLHRRPPTSPPAEQPGTGRVSFAFSSFGGGQQSSSQGPPSPSSSPRLRPSSPHLSASAFGGKPRLTPDQLVDLARQATKAHQQPTHGVAASATSPGIANHSPVLRAQPLPNVHPATFTPLPDDIYLPFIDRPSEVSGLISTPPDVKLFTLLAQTFSIKATSDEPVVELPRDPAQWTYPQLIHHLTNIDRDIAPDFIWAIAARKCIMSHSELIWERIKGALGVPPELDVEFDFLNDDEESPDTSDISDDEGKGARGHWEDWDVVMDSPVVGRKRLSMDSPSASLYAGKMSGEEARFREQMDDRLQSLQEGFVQSSTQTADTETTGEPTIVAPTPHGRATHSPHNHDAAGMPISSPYDGTPSGDRAEADADYISIEPLITPAPSSAFNSPGVNPPPLSLPGSLQAVGDGLGDIAEGAEEEDEGESAAAGAETAPTGDPNPEEDPNLISPSQIAGLRISTTPLPPSAAVGTYTPPIDVLSPISPLPPYPSVPLTSGSLGNSPLPGSSPSHTQSVTGTLPQAIPSSGSVGSHRGGQDSHPHSRTHSRASSFSSIGPFQRSESTGNLAASWSAAAIASLGAGSSYGAGGTSFGAGGGSGSAYGGGGSQYAASDAGDSNISSSGYMSGYQSDGDRPMGNPLFPSNFARLGRGPSLKANNPSTRSSQHTPHARYISTPTMPSAPPSMSISAHALSRSISLADRPGGADKGKVRRAYSHGASAKPTISGLRSSLSRKESDGEVVSTSK